MYIWPSKEWLLFDFHMCLFPSGEEDSDGDDDDDDMDLWRDVREK